VFFATVNSQFATGVFLATDYSHNMRLVFILRHNICDWCSFFVTIYKNATTVLRPVFSERFFATLVFATLSFAKPGFATRGFATCGFAIRGFAICSVATDDFAIGIM